MSNIIITKGTYDKFLTLRPVFKHLLDAFLAENSIEIVYLITNTITYNQLASKFIRFVFEKIQLTNLVDEEQICLAVKTYGNKQALECHYINFGWSEKRYPFPKKLKTILYWGNLVFRSLLQCILTSLALSG